MGSVAIQKAVMSVPENPGNRSPAKDSLFCDMDLPFSETFYPLGFAIEILTNERAVLKAAAESFGHRRLRHGSTTLMIRIGVTAGGSEVVPPEPTRREFNHLYSLFSDQGNQAILDLKTGTNFIWIHHSALRDLSYFRNNFLEKVVYLLLGSSVVTDLHAACVSKGGKGILLCGDSGAGKSTLAYACARAGWTYTSDDTSYLINGSAVPKVIGHSHRLRFRPAAKALFPELAGFEISPRMEGKPSIEVSASRLPGLATASEARIHAVVYLKRHPVGKVSLLRLPEGSASERLRKELYSAGDIRAMHEKMLDRLSSVPTYELHYSDFRRGIDQLNLMIGGS